MPKFTRTAPGIHPRSAWLPSLDSWITLIIPVSIPTARRRSWIPLSFAKSSSHLLSHLLLNSGLVCLLMPLTVADPEGHSRRLSVATAGGLAKASGSDIVRVQSKPYRRRKKSMS